MTSDEFADYVLTMTTRRVEMDTKDLPVSTPVVYMALSDTECLYIGMSRNGMARAIRPDHHVLSHIWERVVKLEVYETRSIADAARLERAMIQEFKPIHNDRQCIRSARKHGRCRDAEIIRRCAA